MKWIKNKDKELYESLCNKYALEDFEKNQTKLDIYIRDYLLISDREDGKPNDPASRFHLGNGASLHRINFMADTSENSFTKSATFMVNYKYDSNSIEENHEKYSRNNEIIKSKKI
jgi:malonyl-CoA decarboxylase